MVPVLEAVPNLSAGRDLSMVDLLVRAASNVGAEVLDASADPDHNRAVLTIVGPPRVVEDASVALAQIAFETIDLRDHHGVHPRVGALDVLPFVPLMGLTMQDARAAAHRVGVRLADEVGIPVYFYGQASDPPGRELSTLRKGQFEELASGFPSDRRPDLLPGDWPHAGAHPTAGVTCVGARPLLLAWNVEVEGLSEGDVRRLATGLRESEGGARGLRLLVFTLESRGRIQLSMNLEHVQSAKPFLVFREIEERVQSAGGWIAGTEVIGMVPDELILEAGADRLGLLDPDLSRVLSPRLITHIARRSSGAAEAMLACVREAGDGTPPEIRRAAEQLALGLSGSKPRNEIQ